MTNEMKRVINKVVEDLKNMSEDKFKEKFEKHESGDISAIYMEMVCEGSVVPISEIKGRRYIIKD